MIMYKCSYDVRYIDSLGYRVSTIRDKTIFL